MAGPVRFNAIIPPRFGNAADRAFALQFKLKPGAETLWEAKVRKFRQIQDPVSRKQVQVIVEFTNALAGQVEDEMASGRKMEDVIVNAALRLDDIFQLSGSMFNYGIIILVNTWRHGDALKALIDSGKYPVLQNISGRYEL